MRKTANASHSLAAKITRAASKQSYYTFQFLADRELVPDGHRAYAYFRWVDDVIDEGAGSRSEKLGFVERQQALLEACYRGERPEGLSAEEEMLADLVGNDKDKNSGLQIYLRKMMAVMAFDAKRRGRMISQAELGEYSQLLAVAVTEAIHHFIGRRYPAPQGEERYLAVRGAHIVHMLRDAVEDAGNGYFNVPREVFEAEGISPQEVDSPAYRKWARERVKLAESFFARGREHIGKIKNWRCRLAGYTYTARFEWMLRAIRRDSYRLRASYPERKSLSAGLWMTWRTMSSLFRLPRFKCQAPKLAVQPVQLEEG